MDDDCRNQKSNSPSDESMEDLSDGPQEGNNKLPEKEAGDSDENSGSLNVPAAEGLTVMDEEEARVAALVKAVSNTSGKKRKRGSGATRTEKVKIRSRAPQNEEENAAAEVNDAQANAQRREKNSNSKKSGTRQRTVLKAARVEDKCGLDEGNTANKEGSEEEMIGCCRCGIRCGFRVRTSTFY